MATTNTGVIGRYEYIDYADPDDVFRPYDPRAAEVAERVVTLIRERMPSARVEHVGSTAIPGCHGKGPVDLLLLYPPGQLATARDTLDGLGFQRHEQPGAFPEERPVRIGTLRHDGDTFRLHVHVVAVDSPEAGELLRFRDALRANPDLVAEYVALKQAVIASGISDNSAYTDGKDAFIQRVKSGALV
jgi:GrpB-like predicted nucleotidyltransferase (UPF0157 family)